MKCPDKSNVGERGRSHLPAQNSVLIHAAEEVQAAGAQSSWSHQTQTKSKSSEEKQAVAQALLSDGHVTDGSECLIV